MNMIMFGIGTTIFIAYMFGLCTMINKAHADQKRELDKVDEIDMDGMGDYSRMGKRKKKQ